jgi:hypothetical protein
MAGHGPAPQGFDVKKLVSYPDGSRHMSCGADALVCAGPLGRRQQVRLFYLAQTKADEGVGRRPGGLPHNDMYSHLLTGD